jgi:hypothetical protein
MKTDDIEIFHNPVNEELMDYIFYNGENLVTDKYTKVGKCGYHLPVSESIQVKCMKHDDWMPYRLYTFAQDFRDADPQDLMVLTQPKLEGFLSLIEDLDAGLLHLPENQIVVSTDNVVRDGVHRLSILWMRGLIDDEIPDEWIS